MTRFANELSVRMSTSVRVFEMPKTFAHEVASAVMACCQRQIEKGRSLDGVNLDAIVDRLMAERGNAGDDQEVFPGAVRQEIASVMMQHIVGDYEDPAVVPEWEWLAKESSFAHCQNGVGGIYELVLNLGLSFDFVPPRLKPVIEKARALGLAYLVFHQGT